MSLQEVTPEQSADIQIRKAARLASIIFTVEQWTYARENGQEVPNHLELEDTIHYLIHGMEDSDNTSTGRISIEKDELVGYAIHLEIGSLSEEEMDTLDRVPKQLLRNILNDMDNGR